MFLIFSVPLENTNSLIVDGRNGKIIRCTSDGNPLPILEIVDKDQKVIVTNRKFLSNNNVATIQKLILDGRNIPIDTEGSQLSPLIGTKDEQAHGILSWSNQILSLSYTMELGKIKHGDKFQCNFIDPVTNLKVKAVENMIELGTPPFINDSSIKMEQEIEVVGNSPFKLICPIDGEPKPVISWNVC